MWTVYVLKSSKSGKLYVGMTQDVTRRLLEHNSGRAKFTSGHMPWEIIYSEIIENTDRARKREKYLSPQREKNSYNQSLMPVPCPTDIGQAGIPA